MADGEGARGGKRCALRWEFEVLGRGAVWDFDSDDRRRLDLCMVDVGLGGARVALVASAEWVP